MLLGLFCWFLIKIFPSKEEFEAFKIKADESLLKTDESVLKEDKDSLKIAATLFKGREKLYR